MDLERGPGAPPLCRSAAGRSADNRKCIKACRNFRPDLLLLGHCELIKNETVDAIRADNPGLRIAYRNVDPLPDPPNLARIRRRADVADAIFLTSASPIPGVPPDSRARVYFLPNPEIGRAHV